MQFNAKKSGYLIAFMGLSLFLLSFSVSDSGSYPLSKLKIYNRALLVAKEQYVLPSRFKPKEMLLSALDSVELRIPEILAQEKPNDKLLIQVGQKQKIFAIDSISTLWDISYILQDVTDIPKC